MKEITINVPVTFYIIMILFVVIEHLMNWWIRRCADGDEAEGVMVCVVYIIKTALFVALFHQLLF